MKNVLKFLSLFLVVSIAFMACGDDDKDPCEGVTCSAGEICENGDCVTDPNASTCETCGTYEGTVDSDGDSVKLLVAPGIGLEDEILEPTPFTAVVTENPDSDSLDMDVSLEVDISGTPATVPLTVTVAYDESTKEFNSEKNRNYTITITDPLTLNIEAKLVELSGTIDGGTTTGILIIDDQDSSNEDNFDATFYFSGSK